MADHKGFKNPLNQAFGMVLRKEREKRSWSYEDVSKKSGLKASYIQQVEKGQFNLHVSKCLALYETFRGDVTNSYLTLEGLLQMLSIISVLEAHGNEDKQYYMRGIKRAAEKLSQNDEKTEKLFEKFFDHNVFEASSSDDAYNLIADRNIDTVVADYLINFYDFEKTHGKRHSSFLETFFDDVPSIFFEYIKDSKENILRLPFQIGFSGLWQWEDRNKENFKSMICICDNPDSVISKTNLSRYKYKYLWAKQFEKIEFVFFETNKTANEIKNEFKVNLKESFVKSDEKDLIEKFADGIKKFNVKVVPKEKKPLSKIKKLLSHPVQTSSLYSALWIFTLQEGYCVSFLADINHRDVLVTQGISLNMKETLKRNEILLELWETL